MNPELQSLAAEPKARILLEAFAAARVPVRFVGGCVRDALLGRIAADRDLATPAEPDAVLQLLAGAGIRAIPTGLAHGTVTALIDSTGFEVTTLRRDVDTDGRHATVAFTADWQQDAARRDFTINAMSSDPDGTLHDYFGGADDLRARRVRFVGDAKTRIEEDFLRTLRFFRFSAFYADTLDPAGLQAARELTGGLQRLSGERVRTELWKLLVADRVVPVWQEMLSAGVIAALLPPATDVDALARTVGRERDLGIVDPVRRFASLLPSLTAVQLEQIALRLRLPNAERRRLALLRVSGSGQRNARVGAGAFAQALYGADPGDVLDAALLDPAIPSARIVALGVFLQGWTEPKFPLSGADLIAAGVAPGPELGALLSALQDWWVQRDFLPDRGAMLEQLGAKLR